MRLALVALSGSGVAGKVRDVPYDLYLVFALGGPALLIAAAVFGLVRAQGTHVAGSLVVGAFALGCLFSAPAIGLVLAPGPLGP